MRIEVGADHWIELRSAEELTGADDDAWTGVYSAIWAERAEADVNAGDDDDSMEMSADGVSMTPKRRTVKVPPNIVARQRDALLARLITAWSYEAEPFGLPLPYTALSREKLPLAACKALGEAIRPHIKELTDAGPKATPETPSAPGDGSASA